MNTFFLFFAAAAGITTTAGHAFVGGKSSAGPVLRAASSLPRPRVTVAFAWHAASVFMITVTAIYLFAAITGSGRCLVLVTTVHCGVLTGLSAIMAAQGGLRVISFPPFGLFGAITGFGAMGVWV